MRLLSVLTVVGLLSAANAPLAFAGPSGRGGLPGGSPGSSGPPPAEGPDGYAPYRDIHTLRDMLVGQRSPRNPQAMPPIARLITDDGDEFILDQSTDKTLLRYENRAEVWVLHPTPGSHGDVVFRNDIEQPVLRTSRWGGITAFTPDRPTGEPVLVTGPSPPLPVLRATPLNVWHILVQASFNVRQAVSHPVAFEAPDVAPGSEGVIADAAIVSSDAIVRLASDVVGRARLAFLRVVQFHEGKAPNARYSDGVMEIVVVPGASYAGRPSSMRVAQAVLGK